MKFTNTKSMLIFVHLVLGVLFLMDITSKLYSVFILFFGILFIIRTKNKNNEAVFWAAYMVGFEVLFRMSGGMVFHELPKYTVLLFLVLGLYVEKKRHHVSVSYLIYILLLLIGIAFVNIPDGESIRKAIAFNLSGPVLLGISAIYFYNRKLSIDTVLNILFVMVLPILSMLIYLYVKTPDLKSIVFNSAANFATSGGYGPNQVSTILGLGIFIFMVHLVLRKRMFPLLILDVLFFMYLIYRGLLTFSRGGMLTAALAIIAFSFYYLLSSKYAIKETIKYTLLIGVAGMALWTYTVFQTGGMLANRYENKNSKGIEKGDITTGRARIIETEFQGFLEHPFFGLGVGGSKYYRFDVLGELAASHNEVGRLLSEHGAIGIIILLLLIVLPIIHILQQPFLARGLLSAFLIFWFLTINHSAMRVAFPSFIYGMSVMMITFGKPKHIEE